MKKIILGLSSAVLGLALFVVPAFASGPTLFGSATLQNDVVNLTSSGSTYSGISFPVASGLTVSDLNNLAINYKATAGGCGGGSPRFQVGVTTPTGTANIFIYVGTPPNYTCVLNTWLDSGNLLDESNSGNKADTSQLGGTFYDTLSHMYSTYGTYPITKISLVVDSGWMFDTETVLVKSASVNSATFSVLPTLKDQCKNGGWMNFFTPFKNQGDCVSYVATGGKNLPN